ncbi:hypothetical protein D9756_008720 [Leucocoprinus leucothites]|uniref:Uncharacterized protein n=1 Tax=Leucocoprinus leucothites TaxID=201217 RepID=A0A8H5FVJ4_9AGAR|nr:hypothetical protein D9756_008720 [Leucoagaricus leucothites]
MKSSGKIIIKPRASKRARRAPSEVESEAPNDDQNHESMEEDDDDVNMNEQADTPSQPADNNDDADEDEGEADDAADEPEGDPEEPEPEPEPMPVPVKRGRGRPKGSGTKSSAAGVPSAASTPRGRPKARGRPRGRPPKVSGTPAGGGLTIRLKAPKGEDDEGGSEEEYTPEAEAAPTPSATAGDAESPAAETKEGTPAASQKEAPMGGGKPFRKIQDKVYVIDGDEFVTEDNPKGDEKIDKWGNLLGGRKFKASTFALPNRHPHRQYMLAIDAARTSGFRDSLYYFRRNPLAFKLNATQPEKDYLISEGKLGSHLRTRSVTLITARSAFKLHGSKMVIDGRWVTDDYYEDKVLAEITAKGLSPGDPVGELPDPNAPSHSHQTEASALAGSSSAFPSSNANLAGGGGGIYRAGGPTTIFGGSGWGPFSDGPLNAVRKSLLSRDGVTEENWMWMMASRVQEADDEWARLRKEGRGKEGLSVDGIVMGGKGTNWTRVDPTPSAADGRTRVNVNDTKAEDGVVVNSGGTILAGKKRKAPVTLADMNDSDAVGVYEPHSNLILYRADTQPTRAKWESIPDPKRRVLGGTKAGNGAWGLAWVDTVMQLPGEDDEALRMREEEQKERQAFIKEAEETFGNSLHGGSVLSVRGGGRGESVNAMTRDVSVMSIGA